MLAFREHKVFFYREERKAEPEVGTSLVGAETDILKEKNLILPDA